MNAPETNLVAIDTLKAVDVFKPGGVEKLLADLEVKVRGLNKAIDPSTEEGRGAAKSLAFKVARSKTGLDELGKEFVATIKKQSAGIDADRRILWDRLETLQKEVRKPVDEWEAAEKTRIADLVAGLDALKALGEFPAGTEPTLEEIDARLAAVEIARTRDWQEFNERADQLMAKVPAALTALREATLKRETDRAELDRLRKAEADRLAAEEVSRLAREQRQRDERIAHEAATKAQRDAEAAIAAAEAQRVSAEQATAEAEARAKAAAEQAELDRRAAAEQAERDRQAAIERERRRVADAKAAEDAATTARERDKNHRATINKAALADLMTAAGLTEAQGKAVVTAIATGKIANVKIQY